jgi:SHAQKYF class myb-like DNA-binding protein
MATKFIDNEIIPYNRGRWSKDEHILFILGLKYFGKNFKSNQKLVKSRSLVQIRLHSQKYFKKIYKKNLK